MKRVYKIYFSLSFFAILSLSIGAQDVSYTQFFAVPYQINPSLTGAIDGKYRVGMIYRDQWRGGLDNPYTTTAVGGEVKFDINEQKTKNPDRVGISLFFLSDQVDGIALNTSQISLSGAYHKSLGKETIHYLGIGTQLSIFQKNINYDKLNFGDEFNELNAYDQATLEVLPPNNFGFTDISIGLNYSVKPSKTSALHVGAALHHITTPNVSFYKNQLNLNPAIDPTIELKARTVVHVSYDQNVAENGVLQPRVIYQQQGNDKEIRVGTNYKYFFPGNINALYVGSFISGVDNIDGFSLNYFSPLVGLQLKSFLIGLSYDVNLRQTFSSTRGLNNFELSIRFNGDYYNDTGANSSFCPSF